MCAKQTSQQSETVARSTDKNRLLARQDLLQVRAYTTFAQLYDELLGDNFFRLLKRNFEHVERKYALRFHSVADAACGTGTFVRYLCRRGVPIVFGLDRSPAMLKIARGKNRGNQARFLQQHLTEMLLPIPIDLITCNFDSMNYLLSAQELGKALRQFAANLNPGGHLIFDLLVNRPVGSKRLHQEAFPIRGAHFRRQMWLDPQTGLQTSEVLISVNNRQYREVHRQRRHPIRLVQKLLAACGFQTRGIHDFYRLGVVGPGTGRALFVLRKRK